MIACAFALCAVVAMGGAASLAFALSVPLWERLARVLFSDEGR